jgi:hypothetical protein
MPDNILGRLGLLVRRSLPIPLIGSLTVGYPAVMPGFFGVVGKEFAAIKTKGAT